MSRPRKPRRPRRPSSDSDIQRRRESAGNRSSFIQRQIRLDSSAPAVEISEEELNDILRAVLWGSSVDRKAFGVKIEQCVRGYLVAEKWEQIVPWTKADMSHLSRIAKLSAEMKAAFLSLPPASSHAFSSVTPRILSADDVIRFSTELSDRVELVLKCAPFPDEGRRRDLKTSFFAIELIQIWYSFAEDEPKRSEKEKPGFGLMVRAVLDLMRARSLIDSEESERLRAAVLNRLDPSKSPDLLL